LAWRWWNKAERHRYECIGEASYGKTFVAAEILQGIGSGEIW
jgi:hypothetical protein